MQLPVWKKLLRDYGLVFASAYIAGFIVVLASAPGESAPLPGDFRIFGALFPFGSGLAFAVVATIAFEIYKQIKN